MCMRPTNERWCYTVTPSVIGWAHSQNDLYDPTKSLSLHLDWNEWVGSEPQTLTKIVSFDKSETISKSIRFVRFNPGIVLWYQMSINRSKCSDLSVFTLRLVNWFHFKTYVDISNSIKVYSGSLLKLYGYMRIRNHLFMSSNHIFMLSNLLRNVS